MAAGEVTRARRGRSGRQGGVDWSSTGAGARGAPSPGPVAALHAVPRLVPGQTRNSGGTHGELRALPMANVVQDPHDTPSPSRAHWTRHPAPGGRQPIVRGVATPVIGSRHDSRHASRIAGPGHAHTRTDGHGHALLAHSRTRHSPKPFIARACAAPAECTARITWGNVVNMPRKGCSSCSYPTSQQHKAEERGLVSNGV